jgi:hypothetical protein
MRAPATLTVIFLRVLCVLRGKFLHMLAPARGWYPTTSLTFAFLYLFAPLRLGVTHSFSDRHSLTYKRTLANLIYQS